MQIIRRGESGSERPYVIDGGVTYDLSPLTIDIDAGFLGSGGLDRIRDALRDGRLPFAEIPRDQRWGAPIARPAAILCIGQNYAAHAAESGAEPPTVPILFHKHPNTMVGPFDDIVIPPRGERVDWEVELGVVIGRRARYLDSVEVALQHVAGYVLSNDVSERRFQIDESGGQWSKGKSCETFNPLGPVLVPSGEIDPQRLRLWSRVNGERRQDSSTADMIFGVAQIVYELSQYLVLEPGDLINTGTPEGVAFSGRFPYLREGDIVELGIEGLGTARQRVRRFDARECVE